MKPTVIKCRCGHDVTVQVGTWTHCAKCQTLNTMPRDILPMPERPKREGNLEMHGDFAFRPVADEE